MNTQWVWVQACVEQIQTYGEDEEKKQEIRKAEEVRERKKKRGSCRVEMERGMTEPVWGWDG